MKSNTTRIPYRSSNLTRVLRESLVSKDANLCVIACVAPNATDTEHTIETLRTVASICGVENKIVETKSQAILENAAVNEKAQPVILPKQWNHEQLRAFLVKNKFNKIQLKPDTDGKAIMKMSTLNIKAMMVEGRDAECAKALFDALRNENDRVNAKLKVERKKILDLKKRQHAR